MWRVLWGGFTIPKFRFKPKVDVYVLHVKVRDGGKLLFLFPKTVAARGLGPMVNSLSGMPYVVGGGIEAYPNSVTVEWAPFPGVWQQPSYLIADIRLTVFEHLLGTWQPAMVAMNDVRADNLRDVLRKLGNLHGVDWVSELGLQMS
jgi:hypothetical protein